MNEAPHPAPFGLLLFPCNGNALEALDCLGPRYLVLGFVDDAGAKQGRPVHGHPVFDRSAFERWPDAQVLAVPGSWHSFRERRALIDGLGVAPGRFACVIHPAARISPLATLGRNVLVMAGAVVTSNAVIGDHVCVMPNTVVHHDVRIGDGSLVGSNVTLAGGVTVGEGCYIGSASSVRDGISIGPGALVGLGSNVVRDVAAGARVAGNPARVLKA